MKHFARTLLLAFFNFALSPLPCERVMFKIRVLVLRLAGIKIGKNCKIESGVRISSSRGELTIGNNVWLRSNVFVQCGTQITIGDNVEVNYGTLLSANCGAKLSIEDNCHIAHMCSLKCSTMTIDPTIEKGCVVNGSEFKDITIGRGSWIGTGVIILPDVTIGKYNVVAAGAVVTKNSPDGVLLAGVPAVVKKEYLRKD